MPIIVWFLIAWLIDRAQLKLSEHSYGNRYCGIGTVDGVLARNIQAPMAYRVLVPWIIGVVERLFPWTRKHELTVLYEPLKIAAMTYALWAASLAIGTPAALLLAALLPATFLFDYWDWAIELGGIALALTGRPELALVGAILLGLSRETAPLIAVTYVMVTGDIGRGLQILGVSLAVLLIVRLAVGKRGLYCSRWMIAQNWHDLRALVQNVPIYMGEMSITIVLTTLTVLVIVMGAPAWPVPLIVLVSGWTMARAPETRVFTTCLLWVAPLLLRGLHG